MVKRFNGVNGQFIVLYFLFRVCYEKLIIDHIPRLVIIPVDLNMVIHGGIYIYMLVCVNRGEKET